MCIRDRLCVEITEENVETQITIDTMRYYTEWLLNSGLGTLEELLSFSNSEKNDFLDYMEDFSLYERVCVNGKKYLLVHGGLEPFSEGMNIDAVSYTHL